MRLHNRDCATGMTMRGLKKTVSGEHDSALLGMRVSGSGWNTALARAAAQVSSKAAPATLGFLDTAKIALALLSQRKTEIPTSSLLLPSGGFAVRLVSRLFAGGNTASARFSAASFVPALLTYLGEKHRIAFVGDDAGRLEALVAHFSRHAPWHDVTAVSPDADLSGRFDLVVVDAAGPTSENRIGEALAKADIGLVIMAGRGLSPFVIRRPVPVRQRTKLSKPAAA